MSQQLKLQVLLSAVDKITGPLRGVQGVAQRTASEIKQTTLTIRSLNEQAKQIDGFRQTKLALTETSRELNTAQLRAQQLSRDFQAAEAPTKAMAREMNAAQNAVRGLTDREIALTAQVQQQRTALQQSGIDTRKLNQHTADLSTKTDKATRALEKQKKQLELLTKQQRKLTEARQSYDKAKQFQGQLAGGGAKAAAVGSAALYGGVKFLAPGVEFDAAMSRVQAVARLEKDSAEMMAVRAQARELGATTSFTAVEVAGGQEFLAKAGFDSGAIRAAMPGLLNLSRAAGLALDATADIGSNILSAFKLPANEMTRLADVLTATATRSNVDLSMLGETMKYMGPTAASLGISIEESAAMAGLLGNIGIQGSQAGTAMREIFTRLVNQTGPAADAIKQLGLEVKDADGNMRSMPAILQDVLASTKDMGNVDRGAVLGKIFGARAGASIAELISQQGDGAIDQFVEILKSATGVAANTSSVMTDNIAGDLDNLKSAFDDVRIEAFEINDLGLRGLVQSITETVRSVGAWMKENPELTKTILKVVAAVAALAAIGGTIAVTIAGILGPLIAMKYASAVLGIKLPFLGKALAFLGKSFLSLLAPIKAFGIALMTNPITWIVLGIVALVAAIYLLWKHWDAITEFISNIDWVGLLLKGWEMIKTIFKWSPLGLIIQAWQAVFGWLKQIDWMGIVAEAWEFMKFLFKWSPLGMIIQAWQAVFGWLSSIDWMGMVLQAWELLKTVFAWSPLGMIIRAWQSVFDFFGNLPANFWQFGADLLSGLIGGITDMLGAVRDKIKDVASSIGGWFKEVLGINSPSTVFQEFGNNTMDGLALGLGENKEPIKEMDRNINRLKSAAAGTIMLGAMVSPGMAAADLPNTEMAITQTLQGAALPDIEDATRIIRERIESAALPDNSETIRRIQLSEQESTNARNQNGQGSAPLTQMFTTEISAGAIVIQAAAGQDTQDIAREIMRQLDERERRAATRERSRFTDLE